MPSTCIAKRVRCIDQGMHQVPTELLTYVSGTTTPYNLGNGAAGNSFIRGSSTAMTRSSLTCMRRTGSACPVAHRLPLPKPTPPPSALVCLEAVAHGKYRTRPRTHAPSTGHSAPGTVLAAQPVCGANQRLPSLHSSLFFRLPSSDVDWPDRPSLPPAIDLEAREISAVTS